VGSGYENLLGIERLDDPGYDINTDPLRGRAAGFNVDLASGTAMTNITNKGEDALAGYSFVYTDKLIFRNTSVPALQAWDISTNGSVLIGRSINSVYSYSVSADTSTTYYPIGGDGGPNITIDINQNYDDLTEELAVAKCVDLAPTVAGSSTRYKTFEIVTADGQSYCMPMWVAAFNAAVKNQIETYGRSIGTEVTTTSDFTGEMSNTNWPSRLYVEYYMDNGLNSSNAEEALRREHGVLNEGNPALGITDPESDYLGKRSGIITSRKQSQQIEDGASRGYTYGFETVYVPWDSSQIDILGISSAVLTDDAMEYGGLRQYSQDITGVERLPLAQYNLEFLRETALDSFNSGRPQKRNQYNIVYSTLEAEGLISKFGAVSDTGTYINSLFMPMANYLVSTFIETVYTFKTIKMEPLTPNTITPTNLSSHDGTVTVRAYEAASTPYTPESYYPASYGAASTFRDPIGYGGSLFADMDSLPFGYSDIDVLGAGTTDDYEDSIRADSGLVGGFEATAGSGLYESSEGMMTGGPGSGGGTGGGGSY
jgi:hypothetical protein